MFCSIFSPIGSEGDSVFLKKAESVNYGENVTAKYIALYGYLLIVEYLIVVNLTL